MDIRTLSALFTAVVAAGVTLAAPTDASACGGLFCNGSNNQQVNQAAERIIFKKHDDGQVTAVVQILYDGPTDRFGWVLPVPSIPEVGLSSDRAFTQLQNATNPQYTMNTTVEGNCKEPIDFCFACGAADVASESADGAFNNNAGGVEVLAEGSSGPYDYVVIQVDTEVDNNVQLALDWLQENNYQATNAGPDLLKPYLDDGNHLLAIRLQKSSDSGAIRPIKLTFEDTHPMVPIKLTAVAANEDMGVLVWVLGESRAIPKNYKHLELNDAYINWFNPSPTYNDVISMAANEASGQGFVTEYAQPTDQLNVQVFTENDQSTWDSITSSDWSGRELELLDRLVQTYQFAPSTNFGPGQPWQGYDEAIVQAFPNLSMSQQEEVKQCGSCAFTGPEENFPEELTAEDLIMIFEDFVVAPVKETQELLESAPYITRLYTTMSAHEMTLDPSFDYNPDLENVSNVHTAERIIECHRSVTRSEAPWRAELPSGLVVRGEGGSNAWPFSPTDETEMPATISVQEVETTGPGTIVRDNIEDIRSVLDRHNAAIVTPRGCGCGTTNDSAPGGSILLLLVGMVGLGLRRRT